jgi:hypothetical protein
LDGSRYPLVIRGDDYLGERVGLLAAFDDMLNQRFAGDQRQGFGWEPC